MLDLAERDCPIAPPEHSRSSIGHRRGSLSPTRRRSKPIIASLATCVPVPMENATEKIVAFDAIANPGEGNFGLFVREEYDARWVHCQRPFVVVGGELTLEMLDLRYDPTANFYEAPLHIKALGGCFVIDDFGRQLVSPTSLLNRWIVPLENRVDYLKLHTGRTFSLPFEAIVIFSTNLEPEDLMDPAFLRRIPYKIEVGGPNDAQYRTIFVRECERQRIAMPLEAIDLVIHKLTREKGMQLASYQPRFILNQIVATCRFLEEEPHFEPRFLDYALDNLRVHRQSSPVAAEFESAAE